MRLLYIIFTHSENGSHMRVIILFTLTFLFLNNAMAHDVDFVNYAEINYLSDQDLQLLSENAVNAINHNPDGRKMIWRNSETGAWGYALPSHTVDAYQMLCRNMIIFTDAGNFHHVSKYRVCKYKNHWRYIY